MGEGGERTLSDEGMVAAPPDEAPGDILEVNGVGRRLGQGRARKAEAAM